jgi:hypothetical protein
MAPSRPEQSVRAAPRGARSGAFRRAGRWWLEGWLSVPRRALFGAETRAMAADASRLLGQMVADYRGWRQLRRQPRPPLKYRQMLAAWGIEPADVAQMVQALKGARLRIAGVAASAYGALLVQLVVDRFNSWMYLLLAFICVLALSTNALVISWRLACLHERRYQEFRTWLGAHLRMFRR